MHIKRIWAPIIAGLLLLMPLLPQPALAAGPVISNVSVPNVTGTTATITWVTNNSSDSQVNYGTTTALGTNLTDNSTVNNHLILLQGLTPGTIYYFEVESTDASGTSVDNNGGEYYSFTTGPGISNVSYTVTEPTAANITWTTDNISDSRVDYSTTPPLTSIVYDSSYVTNHLIRLVGLIPDTTYYFEVYSDSERSPANPGVYYSFRTTPPPVGYYSITLNPVCGVCGELVDVGICGEVIGVTAIVSIPGTYHISWDSLTNVQETFTADVAGSYKLTIYTPEAPKGDHTVYLVDDTFALKASAIFTVMPSAQINPTEGPAGTNVTLNGFGFAALNQLQVTFNGTVVATPTTNSLGSWTVIYTIPPTPGGGYTFEIQAMVGTVWVAWVSKSFKVTPKITVTPSSGIVGQTIAINGTGFGNKEKNIAVTFGGKVVKTISYAQENGSWGDIIVVPPVQRGDYKIDASGTLTRARDVPDVLFTVNAGIVVEPISAYIGDTITVTGGGFAIGETGIRMYFDGMDVTPTVITANSSGCWQSSFTLPTSTYGSHTVSASGDITQPAVTKSLNTLAEILGISPDEGAPGDLISLTANGFHGSQQLTVSIGGVAASESMYSQFNGNVVVSFHVPKGSTEGTRTLTVTDHDGATASANFTVTKKTLSVTPLPISPINSTLRSGTVTFKWQGIPSSSDATYTYTLEINKSGGAGTWSRAGIPESSYTLTDNETLPNGTYYWRVKIVDGYGNDGPWSDSIKFRVATIPTWVWVVVGLVVLIVLLVVAYRETRFKVTE